jgi:putative transposase
VLAYCVMCNHIPPAARSAADAEGPLTDEQLLKRLRALYSKAEVATVAKELAEARKVVSGGPGAGWRGYVQQDPRALHLPDAQFVRVHEDLLQRFTRWHNRGRNARQPVGGNLQERGGGGRLASKTMAAYIDLNPVRAGMVEDPAEYRWSSYGEAMGATGKGGAKAKAGLVRAIMADKGWEADARHWAGKGFAGIPDDFVGRG